MFVDASAIVAILTGEDDAQMLADQLSSTAGSATSPIAVWEAAASIGRKTGGKAHDELENVLAFLDLSRTRIESIDLAVAAAALDAFDRYGRRSGHPADLNMGDCFSYAHARLLGVALLYKGKDFALTDIERLAKRPG